ncbi:uncharacterized protein LOC144745995 [Ciona intestinalis]
MDISERIFFIHDAGAAKHEASDPFDGIRHSSSSSLSYESKCWLCINVVSVCGSLGKVCGVKPRKINLQTLCFVVETMDQYTLALGCKLNGNHVTKLEDTFQQILSLIKFRFESVDKMLGVWGERGTQDNILNIYSTVENIPRFCNGRELYLKCLFLSQTLEDNYGCVVLHDHYLMFSQLSDHLTTNVIAATRFNNHHCDGNNGNTKTIVVHLSHDNAAKLKQFNSKINKNPQTKVSTIKLSWLKMERTTFIILHDIELNIHQVLNQLELLNKNFGFVRDNYDLESNHEP